MSHENRAEETDMITLHFETTQHPDFSGWNFYIEAGDMFDPHAFAEAYCINRAAIDPQSIQSVEAAAGNLKPGEWLEVTYDPEGI